MQAVGDSARLASLTGLAFDWWWRLDHDLRLAALSDGFSQRFGLPMAGLIGQPVGRPTANGPDWRGPYAELQARRPFDDVRTTIVDARGRARPVAISGMPEFDESGTFVGYLAHGRELKSADRPVTGGNDVPASVLDNIDQGFVLVDAALIVRAINRRGRELLGLEAGEAAAGMKFEKILWLMASRGEFAGEDQAAAVSARMALAHAPRRGRVERARPDGSVVDQQSYPMPGGGFVLVLSDITELRQREAQLRQSQKMEAIGQLTGGVAHDFNNALMIIMANIEVLLESTGFDEDTATRFGRIYDAAQRAAGLIQQLLAMSRKQKLKPELTDINEMVATTTMLLQRTLGEHVEIRTVLANGAWRANIDRAQLESALVNLALNARDAMRGGGRLLIETRNATFDEEYVARNPDAVVGEYVLLAVTDTGVGMPPDVLERAFEPFFTTKDVGAGTGLGLSMVYGFIKQSNGHIKIYSEVGHGTTIRMYLPRGEAVDSEARFGAAGAVPRGSERILLVEDDDLVRAAVLDQLASLGYRVSQAANGPEGLDLLRDDPGFDLLLTDVVMPWPLSGKQLADEVSKRWPEMRILFMSGYTENAMLNHGHLAPGARLLGKPFRKADLARAVRRALDDEEDPL
jgi:signal transduction histidine kinase/ActR/RegA family two-component response regulator